MRKWMALMGIPAMLATTVIAQQNPAGPTFRATIDYFSTNVIVRDKDGKFVPDLRPEDFRVLEDGVVQTISTFRTYIGGRVTSALGADTPVAAPAMEGMILPATRPAADSSGRIFIVFLDDLHLQPSDTPRVKDLLKKVRDILIKENDLVGFVSTGHSTIEIDPAYDFGHRRFNEAINRVMGEGATVTDILNGAATEGADGPTGLRFAAHNAFVTAYDMIEQLAQIPDRRKAFVYVSNGYDFNPFKDSRLQKIKDQYAWLDNAGKDPNANQSGEEDSSQKELDNLRDEEYKKRTEFSNADLTNEVAQLARGAQKANVTFYPIDPRGLIAGGDITLREHVSYADWRDLFTQQISTLQILADETGGRCVCMTNDFEKGIRLIDNEMSDYYIIGYRSTNPDPLKLRRIVKVEVTRPNLEPPLYRSEYFLPRPGKK